MAARRAGKRVARTRGQSGELKKLRRVSRHAQADVKRLLKRTRKGTLTGNQLKTGLTEVERDLAQVLGFHYFKI